MLFFYTRYIGERSGCHCLAKVVNCMSRHVTPFIQKPVLFKNQFALPDKWHNSNLQSSINLTLSSHIISIITERKFLSLPPPPLTITLAPSDLSYSTMQWNVLRDMSTPIWVVKVDCSFVIYSLAFGRPRHKNGGLTSHIWHLRDISTDIARGGLISKEGNVNQNVVTFS